MKIYPEKLAQHLQSSRYPLYTIAGDEPLLIDETRNTLLAAAKKADFMTRSIYTPTTQQEWLNIQTHYLSVSLFTPKEILDIRLSTAKLTETAKEVLITLVKNAHPDKFVILSTPKLDSSTQKTAWFKKWESSIGFIQIWPINRQQFPTWLRMQIANAGLSLSETGLTLLTNATEGNLLAAKQVIEKLRLHYGASFISDERLNLVVTDVSQTELYALVDDILAANPAGIHKTLMHLASQGVEPILVLWLLSKELRAYVALITTYQQKQDLTAIFEQHHIWPQKRAMYHNVLKKHQLLDILALQKDALEIDKNLKGFSKQPVWDHLLQLCFAMAKISTL